MQPSLNPVLKIAALRLSPPKVPTSFNPSTKPQARATTFLKAPLIQRLLGLKQDVE